MVENTRSTSGLALSCMLLLTCCAAQAEAPLQVTAADYARAEKVLDYNLRGQLHNAQLEPHWLGDSDRFWFRQWNADGPRYLLVNAADAKPQALPAFDQERLGASLRQAFPALHVDPHHLSVRSIAADGDALVVHLQLDAQHRAGCSTKDYRCTSEAQPPTLDAALLPSPDGKQAVFARDANLWLRDLASGREHALTRDGEAHFAYGKLPDNGLMAIPLQREHTAYPPFGIAWSLDGEHLIGYRIDERAVLDYPFVESVPQDGSFRPKRYDLRLALLGDRGEPRQEAFVIDIASGRKQTLPLPAEWSYVEYLGDPACWSADHRHCYAIAASHDGRQIALHDIDIADGSSRTVFSETATTPIWLNQFIYSKPNVRLVAGGKQLLWFSERDGWGQLYLYDLHDGRLLHRVTEGAWLVRDIVHVDETQRQVYFTAEGHEPGVDPYYRQLYRVSLDGGAATLLTPEQAEHEFNAIAVDEMVSNPLDADSDRLFSPSGRYFVDTYSTVAQAPVSVLRSSADGHKLATLQTADTTAVYTAGWRAPERIQTVSADGHTALYGTLYFPPGYRRGDTLRYPLIDAFYGGPQTINAPVSFAEAVAGFNPVSRASLAQLGFVVLTLDARGTPGRSRVFHDIGYGNFADPEIADHIAAIHQLAARYGNFDLDRVGVYGHSFGGYTSARAILSHPEIYKVAVSSAGSQNYQGFYGGLDGWLGLPDYGQGQRFRPSAQAVPEHYRLLDNASLATHLRGHLMLVYGDMDENALPAVTLQLADALDKANKSYDLLYLPNRTHEFFRNDAYYTRRMWDYFVTYLLHAEPPVNYAIQPPKSGVAP